MVIAFDIGWQEKLVRIKKVPVLACALMGPLTFRFFKQKDNRW